MHPRVAKANLILEYAREARGAFQELFDRSRGGRRKTGGATTSVEQDLMRAMLAFSAAGLDALLKQLIRDTLRDIARHDIAVQSEMEAFVFRSMRGDADAADQKAGRRFLARVLVAPSPQDRIVEDYIRDLTGESLQSAEQVIKAVKALGLDPQTLEIDAEMLRKIFLARNQMIHDMDIDLGAVKPQARKRRSRQVETMTEYSDHLLNLADRIVDEVEKKLESAAT